MCASLLGADRLTWGLGSQSMMSSTDGTPPVTGGGGGDTDADTRETAPASTQRPPGQPNMAAEESSEPWLFAALPSSGECSPFTTDDEGTGDYEDAATRTSSGADHDATAATTTSTAGSDTARLLGRAPKPGWFASRVAGGTRTRTPTRKPRSCPWLPCGCPPLEIASLGAA